MSIRRQGGRFAWLMIGAAIGTTVLLVLGLGFLLGTVGDVPLRTLLLWMVSAVLLGGLLGLVPGVRELEVTGARSMLGVEAELVVPRRPGAVHRVQDVAWVQLHLLLGMLTAICLTMLLPASVVLAWAAITGVEPGSVLLVPIPDATAGRAAAAVLGVFGILLALGAAIPLGALAARLAPRLLGPTSRDRLEVALARADREADRIRIARDLHDGIGHALTVVSIQAAAGRRILERDQAEAAQALERIEDTSRTALDELDAVLAQLREETGGRSPSQETALAPASSDHVSLAQVVEDHRAAGMDLRTDLDVPADLPALQREHLVRIVAELLSNARRHGGRGAVHLLIGEESAPGAQRALVIEVENPVGTDRPTGQERGGRGLAGMRERLDLWGGTLDVGPQRDDAPDARPDAADHPVESLQRADGAGGADGAGSAGSWRARATLPLLTERSRP